MTMTQTAALEPTFWERLGEKFNTFVEGCVQFLARLM